MQNINLQDEYKCRSQSKVTLVTNVGWDQDLASQHFDIIAINRYFGWYSDPG